MAVKNLLKEVDGLPSFFFCLNIRTLRFWMSSYKLCIFFCQWEAEEQTRETDFLKEKDLRKYLQQAHIIYTFLLLNIMRSKALLNTRVRGCCCCCLCLFFLFLLLLLIYIHIIRRSYKKDELKVNWLLGTFRVVSLFLPFCSR